MKTATKAKLAFYFILAALLTPRAHAQLPPQPLAVTTVAGLANFGSADGVAPAAKFFLPTGIAVDSAGNVYVTDAAYNTVREISASGVVTTLAGTPQVRGTNNGTGSAALFDAPYGVAVDASGNLYVADTFNSLIRKISPGGVVTTVAGRAGMAGYADDGTNIATFAFPYGVAVDGAGNIYVADSFDNLIRKIGTNGIVSTIAGDNNVNDILNGANFGSADGTNFTARFNTPYAIAVDSATNLYVADYSNNLIRVIAPVGTNWVVKTLAGNTNANGTINGAGTNAEFFSPTGIAVDNASNIYVADDNNELVRLIAFTNGNWMVSTLAGETNSFGQGLFGDGDGFSLNASFNFPWGVAVDSAANVYVTDSGNGNVREITPDKNHNLVVSTLAGPDESYALVDATNGAQARFDQPNGVAVDGAGNMYVADSVNNCIRQVTPAGAVTILAGSDSGFAGSNDGTNTGASFDFPTGVCLDSKTNIYVADFVNSTVRRIAPVFNGTFTNWVTTTLAGQAGNPAYRDGIGTNALFDGPYGVTVDSVSNVYVADSFNNVVRVIALTNNSNVSTFAGSTNGAPGFRDSPNAQFSDLSGVAWDNTTGNVYVADSGNNAVRVIAPGGVVSTPASLSGGVINFPEGIAVDANGNVYIANSSANTILGVPPGFKPGALVNIAGTNNLVGSADGVNTAAQFDTPSGLAVDASGNVYVADTLNNTIRKGAQVITGQTVVLAVNSSPPGLALGVNGTNYSSTPQTIPLPVNSSVTATTPATNASATALATNYFTFVNWTTTNGTALSASTNYNFNLTTSETIIANYLPQYAVALSVPQAGAGTVSGAGLFASNNLVTVTATANAGFVFASWTQDGQIVSASSNFSFTVNGDTTLTANFVPGFIVSISESPVNGGTASPGGTFASNSVITVVATNNANFVFINWLSNSVVVSVTTNYTFLLTSNVSLVANFLPLYSFTVSASPPGDGTVTPAGTNIVGSVVTVVATNKPGFSFVSWSSNGMTVSSTTNYTFTLTTNVALVASFVPSGVFSAPFATTLPATDVTGAQATLNGMASPNFAPTIAWFQWGTNANYGNQTPPIQITAGGGVMLFKASVTGLLPGPGRPYHFRLVASNSVGVAFGADQIFGVAKAIVAWGDDDFGQIDVPPGLSNVVAIAGGGLHSLALTTNGMVSAWGYDYYGQADVPAGLAGATAMAGGYNFSMAVASNVTVDAWGDDSGGQTNIPLDASPSCAVAGGDDHALALLTDGTVVAWGSDGSGQTDVPAGLSNVVAIAASGSHNLALMDRGVVAAWGDNSHGETNVPASLSNVVAIAAGLYHCLALTAGGQVIAWGDDTYGQTNIPATASNVVAIAAGRFHSLALRNDGFVVAWGNNSLDQTNIPGSLNNVMAIASGGYHSLALTADNPPVAGSQTVFVVAGNDAAISLSATDADGDPLSLRIVSLPATGALFQYNAGSRGAAITATNTPVTDSSNRVIFASPSSPVTASFQFVANDGVYDSNPGTITVSVGSVPAAATQTPAQVTSTNAVFVGSVTPNSLLTTAWFQWGTTTNYGNLTLVTNLGSSSNPVPVTALVTGLTPLTIYHYRVVATNLAGVALGGDVSFSTLVQPFTLSSFAFTGAGTFHIGFTGTPGAVYTLWSSSNLVNWTQVGVSVEDFPGTYEANDTSATHSGTRYYQLRWP